MAKEATKDKAKEPEEKLVQSEHSATIGGQQIKYKASAGTILLRDEDDEPTASIFYIAYMREDVALSNRPVRFSFNGGPGSSSVWMHLGMLGPRRVRLAEDGSALQPP
jgi:carboxypeptidase C (cathepsin A)